MKRFFTLIMSTLIVLMFTVSAFALSPKEEMRQAFEKIVDKYEADQHLNRGLVGYCQWMWAFTDKMAPQVTKLDFDLDERQMKVWDEAQNELWKYVNKYAMDASGNEDTNLSHSIVRTQLEACKWKIGFYSSSGFRYFWMDRTKRHEKD